MESVTKIGDLKWGAEIALPTSRPLSKSAHFVGGRYPCRSVAYVPRLLLQNKFPHNNEHTVLDPFMGSGTTAIEASKNAKSVYGVEIDPYARLVSAVSTTRYGHDELAELETIIQKILVEGRNVQADQQLQPDLKNVEYWFDEQNYDDLLRLKTSIRKLAKSGKQHDFLMTAFGDIIRACSKAERQSLKPYISKKYPKTPKLVFDEFARIAPKYITAVSRNISNSSEGIIWLGDDATDFRLDGGVDIAITSPPYINAMDYTRCIKLESAWIGTANDSVIKFVRSRQLGESVRRHSMVESDVIGKLCKDSFSSLQDLDPIRYQTAVAFFEDMKNNLLSVKQALKTGGQYYIIIGNSKIRGIEIPTHEILAKIGLAVGFEWDSYFHYRIRDHRTSIPRGDRGGKIDFEHVIGLTAPK